MEENSEVINGSQVLWCFGVPTNLLVEDPTNSIILIVFNTLTSVTALLDNFMVLITLWRTPSLHSPSNTLLCGLALSGLCIGFLSGPINVGFNIMRLRNSVHLKSCALMNTIILFTTYLTPITLCTLTAMSIDRYLALHLHLRYEQVVTERKTTGLLILVWFFSGLYPLISSLDEKPATSSLIASTIAICLLAVSFTWIKIYQVVRRHQAQIQDQMNAQAQQFNMAKFKKSAVNALFILLLHLVCFLPLLVAKIALAVRVNRLNVRILNFTYILVFLNSSLNPLVYCWRQRDLRAAVKETVKKLCCCRKR